MLDLAVCRLRQITANIDKRQKDNRKYNAAITEWSTKTLANVIANTVQVPQGKSNPLIKMVEQIKLDLDGEEERKKTEVPPEVYVEQGSQVAENPAGSAERLMAGFGAARR